MYQWEKAARDGRIVHGEGVFMPWGLAGPGESAEGRANFSGTGTAPVDRHPFGMSPFGVYAMAGNAREWTLSEAPGGHLATGGSWQDPAYLFNAIGVYPDLSASADLGFRCVRPVSPDSVRAGAGIIDLALSTPVYEPVDEATFRSLLSHYRYDRVELRAERLARVETPDWVRERIAFDGADGDRILAYLFLPKQATPPYQTVVYIPSSSAFFAETVAEAAEWAFGTRHPGRAGRACPGAQGHARTTDRHRLHTAGTAVCGVP